MSCILYVSSEIGAETPTTYTLYTIFFFYCYLKKKFKAENLAYKDVVQDQTKKVFHFLKFCFQGKMCQGICVYLLEISSRIGQFLNPR